MDHVRKIRGLIPAIAGMGLAILAQHHLEAGYSVDSVLLYAAAVAIFVGAIHREDLCFTQIARIVPMLLAVGAIFLSLHSFSDGNGRVGWLLYINGIILLMIAIYLWENPVRGALSVSWSLREWGVLLAIIVLASFMRFYRFSGIPFGTWWDEGAYGLLALRIMRNPEYRPVYVGWFYNAPAHYLYLIAMSFKALGVSALTMRSVSAVMGVGTAIAAYMAGKELFGVRFGSVLATLMAISRWDIN